MAKSFEEMMDELVMMQAEQCAKEERERKEKAGITDEDIQDNAKGILNKFLKYIKSFNFNVNCKKASLKTGVDYKIIKNTFVSNVLGKIADVLGMVISFTGNIIEYAISFISNLISNIINFTTEILLKIVNVITLNCGSAVA